MVDFRNNYVYSRKNSSFRDLINLKLCSYVRQRSREGWGGTPHIKGVGMLAVSLRGVNFAFWSHLGCSGQNAIKFNREGLVYLICIFLISFIYSIHIIQVFSFVCVLTWSLLGVKKSLGHVQIGLL